jgi:uncharacterized membrane protein
MNNVVAAGYGSTGNTVVGIVALILVVALVSFVASRFSGVRSAARTVRRAGATEVGYKPKSKWGKFLLGTRDSRR